MKKFDISDLTVSSIKGVYGARLTVDSECVAVAESCLLIIRSSGQSIYNVGSTKYVSDNENILFLPKDTKYSLYVGKEGECAVIAFDAENVDTAVPCQFYVGSDSDIKATVKDLRHYWTLKGPAYRSKCLSELYGLLTQISSIESFSNSLAGKYGLIHRSVKYIETNYRRQDLYTPMLAKMSGIGETYYRSIFIAVFGVAPTRYIQQYRVDKAKELLINSNASVEDIAVTVGFANSSYFCKVFKNITGLTPSEFAEKARLIG